VLSEIVNKFLKETLASNRKTIKKLDWTKSLWDLIDLKMLPKTLMLTIALG